MQDMAAVGQVPPRITAATAAGSQRKWQPIRYSPEIAKAITFQVQQSVTNTMCISWFWRLYQQCCSISG